MARERNRFLGLTRASLVSSYVAEPQNLPQDNYRALIPDQGENHVVNQTVHFMYNHQGDQALRVSKNQCCDAFIGLKSTLFAIRRTALKRALSRLPPH